jgi:hypothetical protein
VKQAFALLLLSGYEVTLFGNMRACTLEIGLVLPLCALRLRSPKTFIEQCICFVIIVYLKLVKCVRKGIVSLKVVAAAVVNLILAIIIRICAPYNLYRDYIFFVVMYILLESLAL